jgi:hypothetical protein
MSAVFLLFVIQLYMFVLTLLFTLVCQVAIVVQQRGPDRWKMACFCRERVVFAPKFPGNEMSLALLRKYIFSVGTHRKNELLVVLIVFFSFRFSDRRQCSGDGQPPVRVNCRKSHSGLFCCGLGVCDVILFGLMCFLCSRCYDCDFLVVYDVVLFGLCFVFADSYDLCRT